MIDSQYVADLREENRQLKEIVEKIKTTIIQDNGSYFYGPSLFYKIINILDASEGN